MGKRSRTKIVRRELASKLIGRDFHHVVELIDAARTRALSAVNTALIDLYWSIGDLIASRIADEGWGKGTVQQLSNFIRQHQPNARGFSASNLWRMMQFHETYRAQPKLAPLVRELSWTHNLLIMSRGKRDEEREFYLRVCVRERWSKRELERQLAGALFERTVLAPPKIAPAVRELHPEADEIFKDWGPAVRHEGPRGRRICAQPRRVASRGRRISNPSA